jgi:hypothetical protein
MVKLNNLKRHINDYLRAGCLPGFGFQVDNIKFYVLTEFFAHGSQTFPCNGYAVRTTRKPGRFLPDRLLPSDAVVFHFAIDEISMHPKTDDYIALTVPGPDAVLDGVLHEGLDVKFPLISTTTFRSEMTTL